MDVATLQEALPPGDTLMLQNREKNFQVYCVQCFAVETPEKKLHRCSRCKFCSYCDRNCQSQHFSVHKNDCKWLAAQNRDESLFIIGSHKFVLASVYTRTQTIEHGKYLYEQCLDDYIEEYEQKRAESNVYEIIPLRSRMAFLLAALGHDDLAAKETELALFRWSRGERNGNISKYDDLMKLGTQLQGHERLGFASWPRAFLLPLVLVKMRIVADLKPKVEAFDSFRSTSAGETLEPVLTVIRDCFMYHPTPDFLTNQKNQPVGISF